MLRRSAFAPQRKNAGRPASKSAPGFLKWLRGRPCAIRGPEGTERREAAHVDYAGGKGMGTKVADRFAIPLSASLHDEQHNVGWKTFEHRHNFNALAAANEYWNAWPGRRAWEAANG